MVERREILNRPNLVHLEALDGLIEFNMGKYVEVRTEYVKVMGEDLGTAYHLLWNQCAFLHMRWNEYSEMFGKDQETFDVMNGVAPGFFRSVQDTLWEAILLHLCRFADPARVGPGRRTLSLDALLTMPASAPVPELRGRVEEAKSKIKFAQDWRNRSIAHWDLEHVRDRRAKPLAGATRIHVAEAIAAIAAALQAVEQHFTGSGLIFQGKGALWGGSHLIDELRFVSKLRTERERRVRGGTATADDLDWKSGTDQSRSGGWVQLQAHALHTR